MANFTLLLFYCIANRGSVDSIIWFMLHDFQRDSPETIKQTLSEAFSSKRTHTLPTNEIEMKRANVRGSLTGISPHLVNIHLPSEAMKDVTKTITDIADLAIAEFDESELSPQVNLALRQQVVQYVTKGVRDSILNHDLVRTSCND